MTTFLALDHLSKTYGRGPSSVQAVRDLSLTVEQGEIFGFLGPNGAGKTTTIAMICGLLAPDAGQVLLGGAEDRPGRDGAIRARVGACPQTITIWEKLTCLENLEFIGAMYTVPPREAHSRALALLDTFGLAEKRGSLAGTLSGGMQRRLNLALALVHDPDLLVLDEPEAGLDPQSRVMVRDYIHRWVRGNGQDGRGRTVIFTTHNMDEAQRLVDRVAIIDHGCLLEVDTPAALIRRLGAGDVLELSLPPGPPSPADAPAVLSGLPGCEPRLLASADPDRHLLAVRLARGIEDLPAALSLLRAAGYTPGEARLRASTLEDVFIALTGRSLRD